VQPDISNVETSDWVAGGSALLLFIALFLPWTHVKIGGGITGFNVTGNAGASFGWISILSVLAVEAMLILIIFDVDVPVPAGLVYLGAGGLALLLTVLVMLFRPIGGSAPGISKIPWFGAFIGLIAAIGILVGGYLKFQADRY
jgi:hypothetical protein